MGQDVEDILCVGGSRRVGVAGAFIASVVLCEGGAEVCGVLEVPIVEGVDGGFGVVAVLAWVFADVRGDILWDHAEGAASAFGRGCV